MTTISLTPIDLSLAEKHEHPDIKTGSTYYLIKHSGSLHIGKFGRQWFGLSFIGWFGTTLQFDAPGSNKSSWEEVWEVHQEVK